jgi:hypothetical protein
MSKQTNPHRSTQPRANTPSKKKALKQTSSQTNKQLNNQSTDLTSTQAHTKPVVNKQTKKKPDNKTSE